LEEKGLELHMPFMNYAGPGTHVYNKYAINDIQPHNAADRAALIHDINYLINSNSNEGTKQADAKLLHDLQKHSNFDLYNLAMQLVFRTKQGLEFLGLPPKISNTENNKDKRIQNKIAGWTLRNKLIRDGLDIKH